MTTEKVGIEAEYTLTEKEYVQASKLYARLTKKQILLAALMVITLLVTAYFAGDSVLRGSAIGGLIGGLGGYLVARYFFGPWRVKHHYRNYPAIKEQCVVKVNDKGVQFESVMGEAFIEWRHIIKWREDDYFLLVYSAPHLYYPLPKRLGALTNQLSERLAENVGKES